MNQLNYDLCCSNDGNRSAVLNHGFREKLLRGGVSLLDVNMKIYLLQIVISATKNIDL